MTGTSRRSIPLEVVAASTWGSACFGSDLLRTRRGPPCIWASPHSPEGIDLGSQTGKLPGCCDTADTRARMPWQIPGMLPQDHSGERHPKFVARFLVTMEPGFLFLFLFPLHYGSHWTGIIETKGPLGGPHPSLLVPVSKCQLLHNKEQKMATSLLCEKQLKGVSKRLNNNIRIYFFKWWHFSFIICKVLVFCFDHLLFTTLLRKRYLPYRDGQM